MAFRIECLAVYGPTAEAYRARLAVTRPAGLSVMVVSIAVFNTLWTDRFGEACFPRLSDTVLPFFSGSC